MLSQQFSGKVTIMDTTVCGVGIIGFGPGSAAQTFHVPLLEHEAAFSLRIVSSLQPDEARPLLGDVPVTGDVDEVINHPEVQLVVVSTPNAWHYEYAKRALAAGKHVVVEKPLAITVAEADELIALAKQRGVLLSQFHNRRWDGGFLTLQQLLADERLGKPSLLEMHYDRFEPQLSGNWREDDKPGNGMLYDLGVHLLDQTLALFGRPQSVSATILSQRAPGKADDYFDVHLDYGQLQVVLGANLLAAIPGPRYRLCGSHGTFVKAGAAQHDPQAGMLIAGMRPGAAGWGEDTPDRYGQLSDGKTTTTIPTIPGAYQSFYHGLGEAILNGKPLPAPVEDARDIIAIIEAAKRSHQTGRRVSAEEIGFINKGAL